MDPHRLYTEKADTYVSFASRFSHQQGITALLLAHGLLRDGMRILDAGCGTGFATLATLDGLAHRGFTARKIDAFDLTPRMLERFEQTIRSRQLSGIELRQADVRRLDTLPPGWTGYDLIVSVSMLEYVPLDALPGALRALRTRLAPGGRFVFVITRRNPITAALIEKPWHAHRYSRPQLADACAAAGWHDVRFAGYPARYFWLNLSNHVVIASADRSEAVAAPSQG
ncbi:MAG TPA: class I SAM-dependent methyltransferase [Opitutaceae bacterium]